MSGLAQVPAAESRALRSRVGDWLEISKFRLTSLVLVTVAAGYWLVMPDLAITSTLCWTLLGVGLTSAGGAALNQYLERHLDGRMERTKSRPLPAGRMRAEDALWVGVAGSVTGIAILAFLAHPLAALLAALSALNYVLLYTPLKRVTPANTLVGAVTGALPPLIGQAAAMGSVDSRGWALFAVIFVWQVPHFLAIAWIHRMDYERAGMRMLPIVDEDGRATMRWTLATCVVLVPVGLLPSLAGLGGTVSALASVVLGLVLCALAWRLVRTRSDRSARSLFYASIVYLPALLALLIV